MPTSLSAAVVRVSGVAVRSVVPHLLERVTTIAARWTLPLTGLAFGAYLTAAFVLVTVGFLLRFFGERRAA